MKLLVIIQCLVKISASNLIYIKSKQMLNFRHFIINKANMSKMIDYILTCEIMSKNEKISSIF